MTDIVTNAHTGPVRHTGRPITKIDPEQVRILAGRMLSVRDVAGCLGLSRRTIFNRLKSDPSLRAAYRLGISEAILKAADVIMNAIETGDVKTAKFFLRVRAGWVDPTTSRGGKGRPY